MPTQFSANPVRLDALREVVSPTHLATRHVVSSGCAELDQRLLRGGVARGSLLESLGGSARGAAFLTLSAARSVLTDGGALVVIDASASFYPPALVQLGIALDQVVIVQPSTDRETLWAYEQSLRSAGVAAVLAWPERLTPLVFRRLQLAAEEGGTLGLLVRPAHVQQEPSWADVRWLVSPAPSEKGRRRFLVDVLRGQIRMEGVLCLEVNDEGTLCVVPNLADSKTATSQRSA